MSAVQRKEFREYKRVDVNWPARFSVNGWNEYQGSLKDVSGCGLAVNSNAPVRVGDRVVLYSDTERFEGRVVRQFDDGFAIRLNIQKLKRCRLISKLMWHMNAEILSAVDERRLPRQGGNTGLSSCRLSDGVEILCRVLDMSLISANIEASHKPDIGTKIRVGRADGTVVRLTPDGFAVVFDKDDNGEAPVSVALEKVVFEGLSSDSVVDLKRVS